jgi:hypothetical protein
MADACYPRTKLRTCGARRLSSELSLPKSLQGAMGYFSDLGLHVFSNRVRASGASSTSAEGFMALLVSCEENSSSKDSACSRSRSRRGHEEVQLNHNLHIEDESLLQGTAWATGGNL